MRRGFGRLGVLTQPVSPKNTHRMNVHSNARLCPRRRAVMVDAVLSAGLTQSAAATAFGVSVRTVAKWISRFRAEGLAGLRDRSSRPRLSPRQTLPAQQALVLSLRVEQRLPAFQIARSCGLSKATVSRLLRRHDLHRHRAIHPPPPVVRYQREFPGELIHFDIKTLGKFERPGARHTGNPRDFTFQAGYEHLHVAIDDASRLAFAQLLPDASAKSALAFLDASLAFFATHAITAQAVMTDNGPCYNARVFRRAVAARGLRHIFTRPYTPRTNALYPNLLARVGLRPHLSILRPTCHTPCCLPPPLQLASSSPLPSPFSSCLLSASAQEQPLDTPHLPWGYEPLCGQTHVCLASSLIGARFPDSQGPAQESHPYLGVTSRFAARRMSAGRAA